MIAPGTQSTTRLISAKTKTVLRTLRTQVGYPQPKLDENGNCKASVEYSKAAPFEDIPGPKGLPLLGVTLDYIRGNYEYLKMREVLKSFRADYGPVVKETVAGDTYVHLFDPDDIGNVLGHVQAQTDVFPLFPPLKFYRKWRGIGAGLGNV
ncbi:cytochrome P450 10-like [Lingula anatina]|uniref:Cytochrome P450 10-like n=1 Tax=Lingula anatina TaxID=7574 RepID=A0A1S3K5B3_LINAN|nr:cytochrome P450 10-like [Lingula anatina]|eukprot:XP_013417820.1 cytochrome P450 10-like [Lingula anatina]